MELGLIISLFAGYLICGIVIGRWFGIYWTYLLNAAWCSGWAIYAFVFGDWVGGSLNVAGAILWFYYWQRKDPRKRFKRLLKAIGDKTRQLIKAMSDFVKGAVSPVLQPV